MNYIVEASFEINRSSSRILLTVKQQHEKSVWRQIWKAKVRLNLCTHCWCAAWLIYLLHSLAKNSKENFVWKESSISYPETNSRISFFTLHIIGGTSSSATLIWTPSRENLSSEVCDQLMQKPVCSATEAGWSPETLDITSMGITLSRKRTTKTLIRLCGLCCSHICHKTNFLMMWPDIQGNG